MRVQGIPGEHDEGVVGQHRGVMDVRQRKQALVVRAGPEVYPVA